MHRQEFERHPKLAESIQLLAVTQSAMTLTEWNDFIENLCAALVDGDAAQQAAIAELLEALREIGGNAKLSATVCAAPTNAYRDALREIANKVETILAKHEARDA